jgi:transcriptional regulator with XRE-family HTH domain
MKPETTDRLPSRLRSKNYRDAYVVSQLRIRLPFELRAIRIARGWSQGELARRAGMAQSRISAIESPGKVNLSMNTLLRLASAFDCALKVSFVTFGELVRSSEAFDPDNTNVLTFQEEIAEGMR